ncbi:MAG: nucleotidyltransferase domain-containing protein [Treponema sp.]|nr:nucleotidyltransferase domain-containing protein [Treponema sp.]
MEKTLIAITVEIKEYIETVNKVKFCRIFGSITKGKTNKYSDIDLEVDVSGNDNSIFITLIPEIINNKFPILFYDYAPSLMPEQYIVSMPISEDNPFLILDIKCIANPHMMTLRKENFMNINKYTHIIKVFVANFKHYIRGDDCSNEVLRMYKKLYTNEVNTKEMLIKTYKWLQVNADKKYKKYLSNINIEDIKNI